MITPSSPRFKNARPYTGGIVHKPWGLVCPACEDGCLEPQSDGTYLCLNCKTAGTAEFVARYCAQFVAEFAQYERPHITRDWDENMSPICVPDCPRCTEQKETVNS